MIFKILDRDENYIKNIEGFDYEYSWTLNGIESLSFTTYESGLEPLYRILYQDPKGEWIEFIITEPVDEHTTTEGVVYSVYAVNSFYETDGDWLEDKRPQNTTAWQALETALSPSRWEVGKVDDLGLNSTNFYRESTRSAVLEKIVPTWRAELETKITVKDNKITNRTVNLHKRIGSFWGKRFVFKKDMDKIKRTINTDDFCTALYGFGKGEQIEGANGYGRRIDFAEVNNGKSYVENLEAKELFGRNSQNGKQHIFGKVEFDQCEDKKELLELTLAELEKRSRFNVTYECDVIDLGIEFESVNKGDTVIVKDNDLGICISARIFEYKEKDNGKIHIKLGNYQPLMVDELNKSKEFLDQFRSKQGVWDRSGILSEDGLDGSMVDNLIKALNEDLNSTGGYVYFSDDGKGMITYDKPIDKNPTKAIQILGGSFRMANEKLANGEWNWRTIGTGDGLVADAITTGSFNADLIKTGTLMVNSGAIHFGSLENMSANISNTELSANIQGQQTQFNANNPAFRFDYGIGAFTTTGNIDVWTASGKQSFHTGGLTINNGYGSFIQDLSAGCKLDSRGQLRVTAATDIYLLGERVFANGYDLHKEITELKDKVSALESK